MKSLLYFGCRKNKGHHLFCDIYGSRYVNPRTLEHIFKNENISFLKYLDGVYAPKTKTYEEEGLYQEVNIGRFKILAWWDRSIDDRHASNSALIGYGYNSSEEILEDYVIKYNDVFIRQPLIKPFIQP